MKVDLPSTENYTFPAAWPHRIASVQVSRRPDPHQIAIFRGALPTGSIDVNFSYIVVLATRYSYNADSRAWRNKIPIDNQTILRHYTLKRKGERRVHPRSLLDAGVKIR